MRTDVRGRPAFAPVLALALFLSAIAGLFGTAALIPSVAPPSEPTSPPPSSAVAVDLVDSAFRPAAWTVPAGRPITFVLRNAGSLAHDFSNAELRVQSVVRPGQTVETTLTIPAGEYAVYCTVPGHRAAGMVGRLVAR